MGFLDKFIKKGVSIKGEERQEHEAEEATPLAPPQPLMHSSGELQVTQSRPVDEPPRRSAPSPSSILFEGAPMSAITSAVAGMSQQDYTSSFNSGYEEGYSSSLGGPTLSSRNILVVVPNSTQDITHIVHNLQRGEACVINLERIPHADAQRRLDFLSGVICALGGSIKGLDEYKYILTPQGLGVRG